ncbi:hypothetical protein VTO42DRAFT_2870 [Malbranchea cinnamomea]
MRFVKERDGTYSIPFFTAEVGRVGYALEDDWSIAKALDRTRSRTFWDLLPIAKVIVHGAEPYEDESGGVCNDCYELVGGKSRGSAKKRTGKEST